MEEDVKEADKETDMGEAPPTRYLVPEQRCWCHQKLSWQLLAFGWVVEVTRWPGQPSARGPGVRHPPYRQSSCPRPRQTKSWLPGSMQKNRWRRKPAKEEMCPPWRW